MGQIHASGNASKRVGALQRISVLAGFFLAGAMVVLQVLGSDLPISVTMAGAISFGAVAAIPPTLALMAAKGRFGLYAGAGFSAVSVTSLALSSSALAAGVVLVPRSDFASGATQAV